MHLIPNWLKSSCSQMFYKISVLKIFAKCARKHLFWSHFLIKLQVSRPTKRLEHRYFSVNFSQFLEKCYRTLPDDCPCWFLSSKQSFMHWSNFVLFSIIFFPFIIDNYNYRSLFRKCMKMKKKIQLGKPVLNNFKAYRWQKWKT